MNRFSKLHFCFILFFLISLNSFSQSGNQDSAIQLPNIIPASPTAHQFTEYGDVEVNESSGTISPSIPIYTYATNNLSIPIGLGFSGNGVKVDQISTWTGINWNLNAGGVITRMIKDEDDFKSPRIFYTYDELYSMINSGDGSDATDLLQLKNLGVDTEVDIFNFNFGTYSGSFFLKPEFIDGNNVLTPYLTKYDTELKIEIGEVPIINGFAEAQFREIIITDPNGIRYFFGGENASEQSKNVTFGSGPNIPSQYLQTAYYLYRIEHPYGDIINLQYETPLNYSLKLSKQEHRSIVLLGNNGTPGMSSSTTNQVVQNGRFLKKIYSNRSDLVIDFNNTTISNNLNCIKKLNSIEIKNGVTDSLLQRISLSYQNSIVGGVLQRFFLTEVVFKNQFSMEEFRYSVDYHDINALPERFSTDQDHMGYYNNKGNGEIMLPNIDQAFWSVNGSFSDKSPDFEYAKKGVLNTLHYPTGGQTNFYYESAPDGYGIRLKATRDRDLNGGGAAKIKRYIYKGFDFNTNSFDSNESITHMFTPRYSYNTTGCNGTETTSLHNIQSTSLTNLFCNDINKRMYNKVTVLNGVTSSSSSAIGEGGAIVKEFIVNNDALSLELLSPFDYDPLPSSRSNRSLRNGTLLKETHIKKIDNKIQKVKEKIYQYNAINVDAVKMPNLEVKDLRNGCPFNDIYTMYLGFYDIISSKFKLETTTTIYFDYSNFTPYVDVGVTDPWGDLDNDGTANIFDLDDDGDGTPDEEEQGDGEVSEMSTIVNYSYGNNYIQPTKINTFDSAGNNHETKLYYPYDVYDLNSLPGIALSSTEFSSFYRLKAQYHQIKEPIQIDEFLINNGELAQLSSKRKLYRNRYTLTVPSKISLAKRYSILEDVVVFHDTDTYGNPVEVSKADGTSIYYIWGYNKTKPIAKIENFTVSQSYPIYSLIETAINASNLDIGTMAQENTLRAALADIQTHASLKNAQMTYFTYDPLIGVTSVTDPKGYTIYYEYDDFQRLKLVKDASGHLLSEYKTNFKN
ncbi:RHS repeat domain-containing protein [Xanthomarina gelatinilytica]|uniref:RHS repeat domain-containing protein n=1 Tax=Xanthomarina gelatinilytica TaxID=1137281 RepID=UPI003AA7C064